MSIHLVYPDEYQTLLQHKAELTEKEFAEFQPPSLEIFSSPASHFRMRAEFKIWHSGETAHYAMHEPGQSNKPFVIDNFPVASQTINTLMPLILNAVNSSSLLRERLFQMEFLTSTLGEAVITLIYHKRLDEDWTDQAKILADKLDISIIGRSRKQKVVIGKDYVNEVFTVQGKPFRYRQVEAAFSQPNAAVCEKMLNWAVDVAMPLDRDLLELYCGNGNFTLPLSHRFNKVLATEISKSAVDTALTNIADNGIENIWVVRMSSEEFTQAVEGARKFRRLKDIELSDYNFSTIFVDPPRAGLDKGTLELARRFDNILYISCNPLTLKENIASLLNTHRIERFALFDQFPYTKHRECGVLLRNIGSGGQE